MEFTLTRTSDIFGEDETTVNIETLEQLLSFVKENGKIVLKPLPEDRFEIEIYDQYRE